MQYFGYDGKHGIILMFHCLNYLSLFLLTCKIGVKE
jgi:hypothetical protein